MDYEKRYKESLERAKAILCNLGEGASSIRDIETIFPELAESEDERIRKALVKQFGGCIKDEEFCHTGFTYAEITAWLKKQKEPEDKGEISDGYHTFNELYYYRMLYNAAFFNLLPKEWVHKSKKHHTGEECFGGGWFVVMAQLPTGQISNHYELKDWDLFQIPEKETADEWDGHTPQEAAERLYKYLLESSDEWIEEDEEMLDAMVDIVANSLYEPLCPRDKMLNWLKSLRPQPHWKPSEEQMMALKFAIGVNPIDEKQYEDDLLSLYAELQKLM